MSLQLPTSKSLLESYGKREYARLSQLFIDVLRYFDADLFSSLNKDDLNQLNDYMNTFLYVLTQPDFDIPNELMMVYANLSHMIANVTAISCIGTTDPFLKRVLTQDRNLVKIMALYSCWNRTELDWTQLFAVNPVLSSLGWFNYQTAPPGTISEYIHDNCVKHLSALPKGLQLIDLRTAPLYFQSTYLEADRELKLFMNQQIQKKLAGIRISNNPAPKSVAIITGKWQPSTAVYKSCYHQIEALSKKYDLTLVHFGSDEQAMDLSLFKQVKKVTLENLKTLHTEEIKSNDFQLAYFPDIGMNYESTALANLRLAPIMVTGYGHPVSTFGSCVDYFIGGQDSESPTAQDNYSEKLVLIPGIGAHPVFPNYERQYPTSDTFYINCCWTSAKINYPMLQVLKEIQSRATKKVVFQFFPSWTIGRYQNAIPFMNGLAAIFTKEGAIAYGNMPYQLYLARMEDAQFTLDSYPFGGYNTIVDSLFVGCPVVTLEGNHFYNRASSAVMRKVGIPELVAKSKQEYVEKALRLIDGDVAEFRNRVSALDLRAILVDNDEPKYFVEAIDSIIKRHGICR